MPVIGRLDGQVDEVLIAPLERRRRRDGDESRDGEPSGATENRNDLEKQSSRDEPEKRAARGELPVWLL